MGLAVVNVFTLPFNIKPSTSIGLLTCTTACMLLLFVKAVISKRIILRDLNVTILDYLVSLYLLVHASSLIFATTIPNILNLRIVIIATISYFMVRYIRFNQKHLVALIHALGILSVLIASLSVLQLALPGIMNYIAETYFSGYSGYGIVVDFERGRLLHWGNLILIFPFFMGSIVLLRDSYRHKLLIVGYAAIGLAALTAAIISANFRWTAVCFVAGIIIFLRILKIFKYITSRQLYYIGIIFITTSIIGIIASQQVLGYSLIDRILLTKSERDVSQTLGRLFLYSQAIDLVSASPVLGVGSGNYLYNVDPFQNIRRFSIFDQVKIVLLPIASHSELMTALGELGIVGFCVIIGIYLVAYKNLVYLITHKPVLQPPTLDLEIVTIICIFLSLLLYFLYGMFENIHPHNIVFILMVVGIQNSWFNVKRASFPLSETI